MISIETQFNCVARIILLKSKRTIFRRSRNFSVIRFVIFDELILHCELICSGCLLICVTKIQNLNVNLKEKIARNWDSTTKDTKTFSKTERNMTTNVQWFIDGSEFRLELVTYHVFKTSKQTSCSKLSVYVYEMP